MQANPHSDYSTSGKPLVNEMLIGNEMELCILDL